MLNLRTCRVFLDKNLLLTRRIGKYTQNLSPSTQILNLKEEKKQSSLDTKFETTDVAYRVKSNSELIRGLVVFSLCSVNYFVDNQIVVSIC